MGDIIALWCGVFAGAVVSGFSGFAFSAAAGAVLLHVFDPARALPLLMACSVVSQLATMVALRGTVRFTAHPLLLAGGAAGVASAVLGLNWIEPRVGRWMFGGFLAVYGSYLLLRRLRPDHAAMARRIPRALVGTIAGAVGVFTAMPGAIPSIWCELRGCTKGEQRGEVQPFILSMQVLALLLIAPATSALSAEFWRQFALALPALLAGSWLGMHAFRRLNDALVRKAILLVLVVSGALMLR